MTLLLSQNRRI